MSSPNDTFVPDFGDNLEEGIDQVLNVLREYWSDGLRVDRTEGLVSDGEAESFLSS